ncbi:MAG TPA: hypothetical protein VFE08_05325 [Candidatus Sulfotelmatobacter sp.]|nr:hypothetical protein [Candidatus Sulfotelmatobacter sp.]
MVNVSIRCGNSFKLTMPVKRRRAMLASNPLRNSRPELIATMGRAYKLPDVLTAWPGPDRKAVNPAQAYKM